MNNSETINHYLDSWNEHDEAKRKILLGKCFAENGEYLDPHIPRPVSKLAEMDRVIEAFHSRLPHKLIEDGEPEYHNTIFRLKWKMDNQGSVLSYGTFVGEFDNSGKICRIFCFIDKFIGS